MEKLLNKITEQLDNDWAVEAKDIRKLMFYAVVYKNGAIHNMQIAKHRKETLNDLLGTVMVMLEEL